MLRVFLRLLLATAVFGVVGGVATAPACSGGSKTVKKAKKGKKNKADNSTRALVSEARDDAKNGEYDAADKKYADAYAASKDFDILEERVDFLIHSGRATKAVDAAKAYYDANVSD